jgi:hypothetical protein
VPGPAIERIHERLPEIAAKLAEQAEATGRLLDGQPAAPTLDGLTAQWQTTRTELAGYVTALAGRATAIEKALERLTDLRKTWTQARADARPSRAPMEVIERIDGVVAGVGASHTRLQAQRAATLLLQVRAAQEVARCEAVLARVATLRAAWWGGSSSGTACPCGRPGSSPAPSRSCPTASAPRHRSRPARPCSSPASCASRWRRTCVLDCSWGAG